MKIFGYGSLLCKDSLRKTVKEYETIGTVCLSGYRRVFNIKSNSRFNPATGKHSCVLNLEKDTGSTVCGTLYEIPEEIIEALHAREKEYKMHEVTFTNGETGFAYLSPTDEPYPYLENDPVQQEYLDICLKAARMLGDEMYENFIDSTYVGNTSLRNSNLI